MTSARIERRLGHVVRGLEQYPTATAADWQDAVEKQICPFCGAGPFVVVATHVAKKHGIDRFAFREWLGVAPKESICDPFHSAACRVRLTDITIDRWQPEGDLATQRDQKAGEIADRARTIGDLWRAGKTIKEIAAETSYCYNTVRNGLASLNIGDARRKGSSAAQKNAGPRIKRTHCRLGHPLPGVGKNMCPICRAARAKQYETEHPRESGWARTRARQANAGA